LATGAAFERRPVTVIFCDLVDSIGIAQQVGEEENRFFLEAYHDRCKRVVDCYHGYIAQRLGDGVMVCFGYPVAREDDALRAVAAAWDIVEAVRQWRYVTNDGAEIKPRVRVGVHTARAAVRRGTTSNAADLPAVSGDAPGLSSRLQSLAAPQSVILSGSTHRLVQERVQARYLGPLQIKGYVEPIRAYRLVSRPVLPRLRVDRVEEEVTPLTGRRAEIERLASAWRDAATGAGRMVAISGEAGIGKSRLVSALRDRLEGQRPRWYVMQCLEDLKVSAYAPLIELLRTELRLDTGEASPILRDIATEPLRDAGLDDETVDLIVDLLVGERDAHAQAITLAEPRTCQRLADGFAAWLQPIDASESTVLVVEDLQWCDPSTLELLQRVADRVANDKLLVIFTHRDDFDLPEGLASRCTTFHLEALDADAAARVVTWNAHATPLSASIVRWVLGLAGGVPLYLEELTKWTVESIDSRGGEALLPSAVIPDRLDSFLTERMDRLGDAKKTLQAASVIGTTFSLSILEGVTTGDQERIQRDLVALRSAGLILIVPTGRADGSDFAFKHALIQNAAYESVIERERVPLHRAIATWLAEKAKDFARQHPEVLAHHFSRGGEHVHAARYWLEAGKRARSLSANQEALQHVDRALKELGQVKAGVVRRRLELELLLVRGSPLIALNGWSAAVVEENYRHALEICDKLGAVEHRFAVNRGLENVYLIRGQMRSALELSEDMLSYALQAGRPELLVDGYRAVGMCGFFMADFDNAAAYLRKANEIYEPAIHHPIAHQYGSDPGVVGLSIAAWNESFRGNREEALATSRRAVALADELAHPFSVAYARSLAASLYQCLGDIPNALQSATTALRIAEDRGYPYWRAWGMIIRGWARAAASGAEAGTEELEQGIAAYEAMGAAQIKSYALALLGETYLRAGRADDAQRVLEQAKRVALDQGVRFYLNQIHHLRESKYMNLDELIRSAKSYISLMFSL
jgi:predicted ATPase/class 3 adenylate cyclase